MDSPSIIRAYSTQSPFYDVVFHPFYGPGQGRAVRAMNLKAGDRVLEVGAGTGLSLRHYPQGIQLTGIDLAEAMLARAQAKADALGLQADFQIMDAQAMRFADHSFDHVVAMHLTSVVPHPDRLIAELRRVCKRGGSITVANHLSSDGPLTQALRWGLQPLRPFLGFRPLYSRTEFLKQSPGLEWKNLDGKPYGFVVLQALNP